jgi:fructose-bisphosphate aldolase class I
MNTATVLPRIKTRVPRPFPRQKPSAQRAETQAAIEVPRSSMASVVAALLTPGRGLLAADENSANLEQRFKEFEIPFTEESRRDYRELLFTTPGLGEFISGVILFDETIRQRTTDGTPMAEMLAARGIIPGIKVDRGTIPLPGFSGECVTQGLDGLRERLAEYRQLGARFAKWGAVITISKRLPTVACVDENARALAFFAALSQEAGLVPIVEPEVLLEGNHTLERCEEVTSATLEAVFAALVEHRVALETTLLKTGMVLPGPACSHQVSEEKVAEATLRCLRRAVPAALPGIVFLSGGQNDVVATERLDTICRAGHGPWKLSFSFGRALQDAALKIWRGSPENVAKAQAALHLRATCNSLAVQGKY